MSSNSKLPAVAGQDADDLRVIYGELLKCVDGRWTVAGAEMPKGAQLLALATTDLLQRWKDQQVVEVKRDKPLPSVEELNSAIPQKKWEKGIDGQLRPPWQHTFVVYLLDPKTAERFTFANATAGARIAVEDLAERMKWMQALRGAHVTPLLELSNKPMKTQHG